MDVSLDRFSSQEMYFYSTCFSVISNWWLHLLRTARTAAAKISEVISLSDPEVVIILNSFDPLSVGVLPPTTYTASWNHGNNQLYQKFSGLEHQWQSSACPHKSFRLSTVNPLGFVNWPREKQQNLPTVLIVLLQFRIRFVLTTSS